MNSGNSVHERVQKYACAPEDVLFKELDISEDGYDEQQAEKSREKYGRNILSQRSEDTVLYRLRRAFINPFSVILFVLAVISFITDVLLASNFSRDMTTVIIIACMLFISGIVRFVQEMKSKHTADSMTGLLNTKAQVLRNGKWTKIESSELAVGDRVRLSSGERVPADIRLIHTAGLFVSQSVITGESAVIEKNEKTMDPSQTCSDYRNIVFMGSAIMSGSGEGIVLAVGHDTVYGGFSDTDTGRKNGFDKGANSIAWVLIRFMAVLIPVVFIACGLTKGDWLSAFLFALSVAVGLTPEMLPMVINACLVRGSYAMRKRQTLVKNINAMQGFGSMDVLCVDKTGTLTGDRILLEYYMDILGDESGRVLDMAYLNSLYHTGARNHLDASVLRYKNMPNKEEHFDGLETDYNKISELPFDYERKTASVLVRHGSENIMIVKGSVEEICRRCSHIEYRGNRLKMENDGLKSVHAIVDDMLEDGMKVLAVAYKTVDKDEIELSDENGLTLLGYLAFFDAPKKTAAEAVKKLKALNVGIRVLTGDQKNTAVSICARLGIDVGQVLTGRELDALAEDRRQVEIENTTVFAELTPRQKLAVVQALQSNGHTVGFLGDGMNDLPAMTESDVGISVDTDAEAVRECADVILLKKDLNVLEEGIIEGRKAFSNMSKYIKITASSNFGNIFSIVIASVFLPFFPITSVQLLLLNLLYDILCLVLPWDRVDGEMCARPLEWSGRSLGRFMVFFGPISSVFDIITFAFLFFFLCPSLCGGSFSSLAAEESGRFIMAFQTGWFLESMWTQVLILHLLRTKKVPIIQSRPSRSVMAVTTAGILLFTAATYTPLGSVIGLVPLPGEYYLFLIAAVIMYLLLVTLAKYVYIKKYKEII